ncbi:MAG: cytidine deaminase [Bacteroidetes bacterium]|nr:MAG: cytidine deaminase [Bacteroidota bacterium]
METRKINIEFEEYNGIDETNPDTSNLIIKAVEATKTAYAPYSLFRVGAAVRLNTGEIIMGSNQENIAYPSGLCAERVALFSAAAQHPEANIEAIAVTASHDFEENDEVFSPCGACRQVMAEFEQRSGKEISIIINSPDGKVRVFKGVKQLLPFSFNSPGLNKSKRNK